MPLIEVYGYLGSALIAFSLMMSKITLLRWINAIGAAIFSSYGVIIEAWPVAVLNGFIVLINAYQLYKIYQAPKLVTTTRLAASSPYVKDILSIKWPQLVNIDGDSHLEVTFLGEEPTEFNVLT